MFLKYETELPYYERRLTATLTRLSMTTWFYVCHVITTAKFPVNRNCFVLHLGRHTEYSYIRGLVDPPLTGYRRHVTEWTFYYTPKSTVAKNQREIRREPESSSGISHFGSGLVLYKKTVECWYFLSFSIWCWFLHSYAIWQSVLPISPFPPTKENSIYNYAAVYLISCLGAYSIFSNSPRSVFSISQLRSQ